MQPSKLKKLCSPILLKGNLLFPFFPAPSSFVSPIPLNPSSFLSHHNSSPLLDLLVLFSRLKLPITRLYLSRLCIKTLHQTIHSPSRLGTVTRKEIHFSLTHLSHSVISFSCSFMLSSSLPMAQSFPSNVNLILSSLSFPFHNPLFLAHFMAPPLSFSSPSGDVTAELVYANYGTAADFALLSQLNVSVEGKIVITRYGANSRCLFQNLFSIHFLFICYYGSVYWAERPLTLLN